MMVATGLISAMVMRFLYKRQNRNKAGQTHTLSTEEIADLGDRAPTYHYVL